MNLTEPQAGSDLAALRARAERAGDGTYRIFGQKIFITYGEHDLTDNIIHLVLARLPDAPAGTKGISLFLGVVFSLGSSSSIANIVAGYMVIFRRAFKVGDRVKRGQELGRIGNSGDSRWPHLHFQLTSTPSLMGSEGMPFVLDQFRAKDAGGSWEPRRAEFPWGDDVAIDFGT
jgi:hypothetical protein